MSPAMASPVQQRKALQPGPSSRKTVSVEAFSDVVTRCRDGNSRRPNHDRDVTPRRLSNPQNERIDIGKPHNSTQRVDTLVSQIDDRQMRHDHHGEGK